MKNAKKVALVFCLFFIVALKTNGQESNYLNYEVGSKATMLGGAVVAGIDNISSSYYNPGALVFIDNSSFSLETSTLFTGALIIKNGAGEDIDIRSNFFDVIPSMIGGIVKSKNSPKWTFAYSSITVNSSLIEFSIRNLTVKDLIPSNSGDELYIGSYDYNNKMRENWIGASAGRQMNENFGLGVSLFAVSFYQDYNRNQLANVTNLAGGTEESLVLSGIYDELRFRSLGLIAKIGANYRQGNHSFGMTITAPKINMDILAKGKVSETVSYYAPSLGSPSVTTIYYGEDLKTTHKNPLKVSLGYQFKMNTSTLNLTATYNAEVKEYSMLETKPVQIDSITIGVPTLKVYDMANQVLNVSVGYNMYIREGLSVLMGARTDFNYSSSSFLDSDEFVPKMSYWDLYHVTGGVIWSNEKVYLTLGADYAFGVSKNDLQQVNLSDPVESEFFFGEKTNNTSTFHNQIYIVLGFSYNF